MGLALNTAGLSLSYASGTLKQKPSTGFKKISDITEVPELDAAPETLDATTFDELEYKKYIPGLKDLGGAVQFSANLTKELISSWAAVVSAAETAEEDEDGALWFQIQHPDLDQAVFFTGTPSPLGMPGATVNTVFAAKLNVTVTNEPAWAAKIEVDEAA